MSGEWAWTSPNGVGHGVLADGRCVTCGRRHEQMRNMRIVPRPEGRMLLMPSGVQGSGPKQAVAEGLTPAELIELAKLANIAAGVDEDTAEDWAWMARCKIEDSETSREAPYAGDGVIAGNG